MKMEIKRFENLENKKSFLHEIKSIFHNYLRLSLSEQMRNSGHKLQVAVLPLRENVLITNLLVKI